MECAMSDVFAGVSAEDDSPVSEHLRLTGGARVLDRDPSEYMADVVIKVAVERGELAPDPPLRPDELSQEQRDQVVRWAVKFTSQPPDGRLTTAVIESAGPIPVSGVPARAVAREYFESKLPAAEVRRTHALQAADSASVPEDWFNAPAYWRAVIAWLDGQGEGTPPVPVLARPQWYFRDDVVELDRDLAISGRPYSEGTTGTVLNVGDDTLVKLAREGRIAVMFPGRRPPGRSGGAAPARGEHRPRSAPVTRELQPRVEPSWLPVGSRRRGAPAVLVPVGVLRLRRRATARQRPVLRR